MPSEKVIELSGIRKHYLLGSVKVEVLKQIDMAVSRGEFVAIMGPSGSGKSTLMNILGLLDRPDEGSYLLEGEEVGTQDDDRRSNYRNRMIGFIFQNFNLLPRANSLRNVILPLLYREMNDDERREKGVAALQQVGLGHRIGHLPTQLSGGERQRVAIARALVGGPSVILADEPTGNLDTKTGEHIIDLLFELNREEGTTLVLVTHDHALAERCQRRLRLDGGELVQE